MTDIQVFETPEALAERCAADFAALVQDAVAANGRFTVALAGGQTPKSLYARLAQEPYRSTIPWAKVWVFWGDERSVPKEHSDSNFGMASEALLTRVSISSSHVLRMRGEDPPPLAARDYEKQMRDVFRGQEWPTFDLILLGMGTDGHTASLMPGTPALADQVTPEEERRQGVEGASPARWVVHNVVRSLQTVRITMTLPAINHAKNIWFLVTGVKKQPVFAKVQEGPSPQYPASLVEPEEGRLRWYVDRAAAEGIAGAPVPRPGRGDEGRSPR
jgi:6-phosphogluconolactonase